MAEGTKTFATSRRVMAITATALAFTFAGTALAQPGRGHHHGPGYGEGADIGHLIAHAKAQLNLNTSQQTQFDTAVAQSKAAMETARSNMQRTKDALAGELAKTEPDLGAVAAVSDDVRAQNQSLRRQVRDQWLALYNTFSPEQKAVVKQMIQSRMARFEQFRERMHERLLQRRGNG